MSWSRSRWLVAVLAVLLLAEGGARLLDGHVAAVDERGHPELEYKWDQVGDLADGEDRPRAVLFGNSMADGAFIPAVFTAAGGAPAYNAGFLDAPLTAIDEWADLVLERTQPETAVVVVHPLDTVDAGLRFGQTGGTQGPSFDVALDRIRPDAYGRLTREAERASALIRIRSTIRQPGELWHAARATVRGDPRPAPQKLDHSAPLHEINWSVALDGRGWDTLFQDGALPADATFPISLFPSLHRLDQDLDETDFDAAPLRSVLATIQRAPRAVMVVPPVAEEVLARSGFPIEFLRLRHDRIVALARAEGVDVVDLSDAGYPADLFHDPVHLNRRGADRFSRDLAGALTS